MQLIHIYKTKSDYKIVTSYRTESWSYINGEPIFIFPISSQIKDLEDKIFESLESSREISESEEEDIWLGNKLLKSLKESSFNKLYSSSVCVGVFKDEDMYEIKPYKFNGKNKGISGDDTESVKSDLNISRKDLTEKILSMLNKLTPAVSS